MSPTSYQTAPPRNAMVAQWVRTVKLFGQLPEKNMSAVSANRSHGRADPGRHFECSAKGIYHDARTFSDFDQLLKQVAIGVICRNAQFDGGEAGGIFRQRSDYFGPRIGDIRFPRANCSQQVAHEAAPDGRQKKLTPHRTLIVAALRRW